MLFLLFQEGLVFFWWLLEGVVDWTRLRSGVTTSKKWRKDELILEKRQLVKERTTLKYVIV